MSYDRAALRRELERDEGDKRKPYRCTAGHLTAGIGHNLDAHELSDAVIEMWFAEDVAEAEATLDGYLRDWRQLDDARQRVLLNMAFNLGAPRLAGFKRLKSCLVGYLATRTPSWLGHAADEMMASQWASQVGERADRLAAVMRGEP